MKKHLHSFVFTVIILLSFNLFSQDFVRVSIANSGEVLKLNTHQILEVSLPSTPSTGYSWHIKDATRLSSIQQIGHESFVRILVIQCKEKPNVSCGEIMNV